MTATELGSRENYIRVFERLGAENVRIVDTVTREDEFIYWVEAKALAYFLLGRPSSDHKYS